jgi:hypothetical protein
MDFDFSIFDEINEMNQTEMIDGEDSLSGSFSSTPNIYGGFDFTPGIGSSYEGEIIENTLDSDADLVPDFDNWCEAEYGSPLEDSEVWTEQTTPFTCGIVSSEMVMKMFGLEISEAELVYEATAEGLLTEDGMSIEGIQTLLENHGIETHIGSGDISELAIELDAGHKIVIPLDSGEIWGTDSQWEDILNEGADHAVVLTGIDSDSLPPKVFLNDPGHPDGKAMEIDLGLFVDAWNDSGNQFIATNDEPFVI